MCYVPGCVPWLFLPVVGSDEAEGVTVLVVVGEGGSR